MLYDNEGVTLSAAPSGVLTLALNRGENLINPQMVDALSTALALAENADHPKSLCVSAQGKFFSNGLDIAWMGDNPEAVNPMIEQFWRLLGRLLVLNCHTVTCCPLHVWCSPHHIRCHLTAVNVLYL